MKGAIRDFLNMPIVIIFTLSLASIGFLFLYFSTGFADKALKKAEGITREFDESDYTKYEGRDDISGSEVISAIKQFQAQGAEICVYVKHTNMHYIYTDESLQTKSTANIANATRKTSAEHINPNKYYSATLTRDSVDDSIRMITFEIVK